MFSIVQGMSGINRVADDLYAVPVSAQNAVASARYHAGMYILVHDLPYHNATLIASISGTRVSATFAGRHRVEAWKEATTVSEAALAVCEAMALVAAIHESICNGSFRESEYEQAELPVWRGGKGLVIDGFTVHIQ